MSTNQIPIPAVKVTENCVPCRICGKVFASLDFLCDHIQKHREEFKVQNKSVYLCDFCGKLFNSNPNLECHIVTNHRCNVCSKNLPDRDILENHKNNHVNVIQSGGSQGESPGIFSILSAHFNCFRIYRYPHAETAYNLKAYFEEKIGHINSAIAQTIQAVGPVKLQISPHVRFQRGIAGTETYETFSTFINSELKILLNVTEVSDILGKIFISLQNRVDLYERYSSGWKLIEVISFDLRINKFKSLGGACYVPTPSKLAKKKGLINIKNFDSKYCFKWAVLAGLFRENKNQNRTSTYRKHEGKLKWKDCWFPMTFKSIIEFEDMNSVAVNVFQWSEYEGVIPARVSKNNYKEDEGWRTVNLLLLQNPTRELDHYVTITSICRLIGKHNCHKKELCYSCLQKFPNRAKLNNHLELCKQFKFQRVQVPGDSDGYAPTISFENYSKQLKAAFTVYADFESLIVPNEETAPNNTVKHAEHIPCSFSYVLVRDDGQVIEKYLYRGEDCMDVFIQRMHYLGKLVKELHSKDVGPVNSPDDWQKFLDATVCHICDRPLNGDKCYDHDHRTGAFRGAAHTVCNLNYKPQKKLPIVIHNFKSYDSHLIVKGLAHYEGSRLTVIPTNSEKYLSIITDTFYFVDSMQHLNASLSKLVENLLKPDADEEDIEAGRRRKMDILYQVFKEPSRCEMMMRKGVYCYDYVDSFERFDETELPPREKFYNTLTNETISESDFNYAKKVFSKFDCKSLGHFHDISLMSDCLLLACVFENFRQMCLKHYKLDPVHYYSLPGLAWDAAMRMTQVKLEQLIDIDQINFVQQGIRGGISLISQRYASTNNRFMESFNKDQDESYIMYLDKNNLYGHAMCDFLPVSQFSWVSNSRLRKMDKEFMLSLPDDGEKGLIIECDLEYDDSLHDKHNDYPLAPEKLEVQFHMLSPYQKTLFGDEKKFQSIPKLIAHLGPRKKYVVHYRNLKFYLQQGLRLVKVHRALEFQQSKWMEKYVLFNTEMRKASKSDFEKNLFKLMVNATFGKSMENVRNRTNVQITKNYWKALRLTSDPRCKSWDIIEKDLIIINMERRTVTLDKPIYVGCTILELSKLYMYDFHYNHIVQKYGDQASLLFSDTDSLCYKIVTPNVYDDMEKDKDLYDFSDYPETHRLYCTKNKKVLGKMKDEGNGKLLTEFVGLSSKMYSLTGDDIRKKACKGAAKSIDEFLQHDTYKEALLKEKKFYFNMTLLRSYKHRIYTISVNKLCLHSMDTKRYICDDGIKTLAFGHYKTRQAEAPTY